MNTDSDPIVVRVLEHAVTLDPRTPRPPCRHVTDVTLPAGLSLTRPADRRAAEAYVAAEVGQDLRTFSVTVDGGAVAYVDPAPVEKALTRRRSPVKRGGPLGGPMGRDARGRRRR